MQLTDISQLISVGRPTIAPNGAFVVFAASRPDVSANRTVGQLWRIDLPGGTPRRLTRGVADRAPRLSPDGTRIAFLRSDAQGHAQIFVLPVHGGEAVQATDAQIGVSEFCWSPDGTRIAFTARVPETGRYGTTEGLDAVSEPPRRITDVQWHYNGVGYIADRPVQAFLIDAPDPSEEPSYPAAAVPGTPGSPAVTVSTTAVALTEGSSSYRSLAFSADGTEVFAVVAEPNHDRPDLRNGLIALAVEGGGRREVIGISRTLGIDDVAVAPDGTVAVLAAELGEDGLDIVAPGVGLWLLETDGPRLLTDTDQLDLGDVGSHLTVDGADFLVQRRTRGRGHLLRVTREGTVTELLAGDVEVTGHAAAGGRAVASVVTPDSAGELVLVGTGALTDFGAAIRERGVVAPVETTITARDGYAVHGWVATPEGDGPFPVILQIHGGPYASYGIHLFDETQVLVDAGYAVLYCNPRGGAGYGRDHGRAIIGRWGTLDYTDVQDFLDGVLAAQPRLDSSRVGIQGGSYGGYLTAWTIAHDHRFVAAIVERGCLDPLTFYGTSDIGTFFIDANMGCDPEGLVAQSPMALVDRVTTPTFVIHSEQDLRCPLDQGTRYYSALKRQGTPTELLIFPGENHELSRGGQPRHRVERFEAILDWWRRYLPAD